MVLHRGGDDARVHQESAVTDHRNNGAPRRGQLRAEGTADTETHGRKPSRLQQPPLRRDFPLLDHPAVVSADIGQHDRIRRDGPLQFCDQTIRMDWALARTIRGAQGALPFSFPAVCRREPWTVFRQRLYRPLPGRLDKLSEREPDVADDPDCDRIIFSQLGRILVDVYELRRGNVMRGSGVPAAAAIAEPRAQSEQHIAAARRAIARVYAVAAGWAHAQRMGFIKRALALRRGRDRDVEEFGELTQLGSRAGERAAMTGKNQRLPG